MATTPSKDNTVAVAQPPPTPSVNRGRARESNGGTPPRAAPALRRTITPDSLPVDFKMPTINVRETNA